jgi:uncharacterized SAM-binding protein YcdF (DUF218 family)
MKKLFVLLFFFLSFIVVLLLAHPFILNAAARYLIVQDILQPSDIILVLGGDDNGERVAEAVRLYKAGYGKKILMSSGPLAWHLTGAEWMKKQAIYEGVPARAILLEDRSLSTVDNARFSLPILKREKVKKAILVTSPYHIRRAKKVFDKVFKSTGIQMLYYPVQKSRFNPDDWWKRHEDTQFVVLEYISLLFYFMKGY